VRRRLPAWALGAIGAATLVLGAGCALPQTRDDLDREVALHHIDLRWGRLENAAVRVTPAVRGAFVQAWAARLRDLELQEIDVAAVTLSADGQAADVVVAITFVDRATMQVRTAQLAERWQQGPDGWRATTPATPVSSTTPLPDAPSVDASLD